MAKWRTNGLCRSSEVWLKTKSGEEFPALITPTNLYADDGSLLGQNMVIQDLTKIEETKHLLQERQEIDKMKDEFLTGITHELKTPLTPIIGFSQALAKPGMLGDLNKRQESAVRTIMNNAIQLRQLVMDLLDIHKLELGRMKFNMAEFDIESMVDGVISSVEYAAQEKKIKIIKALDMTGPLIGDQFRVAEILANLVYNAVDFSPENTGKIEILSALEGQHGKVYRPGQRRGHSVGQAAGLVQKILSGIDNGSPQARRHRLGPVHMPRAGRGDGGQDWRQKRSGKGQHVLLYHKAGRRATVKILAVDDNEDIIKFIEMTVSVLGHEFDSAGGGKAGLEKIRTEKFDMVFLDLSMPDFSGMDVVNALDEDGCLTKQKIVLFTASYLGVEDLEKKLVARGVHSVLAKPADIDQIIEKIEAVESEINS